MADTPSVENSTASRWSAPQMHALVQRFDTYDPRYASYPTADHFHNGFDNSNCPDTLHRRAATMPVLHAPLPLYMCLPFCANLCHHCGCNEVITKDRSHGARYIETLTREIAVVTS